MKKRYKSRYEYFSELVPPRTENPCVPGSIPGPGTNICVKNQALTV
jgi:hypothetical protein